MSQQSKSGMNWTYDNYHKMWTGSRGTGRFAVQRSTRSNVWYSMLLPFASTPVVLATFPTKAQAIADAERVAA